MFYETYLLKHCKGCEDVEVLTGKRRKGKNSKWVRLLLELLYQQEQRYKSLESSQLARRQLDLVDVKSSLIRSSAITGTRVSHGQPVQGHNKGTYLIAQSINSVKVGTL
jgi:hypothetical protein